MGRGVGAEREREREREQKPNLPTNCLLSLNVKLNKCMESEKIELVNYQFLILVLTYCELDNI